LSGLVVGNECLWISFSGVARDGVDLGGEVGIDGCCFHGC